MENLLVVVWIVTSLIFIWASTLALGKVKSTTLKKIGVLSWQKTLAVLIISALFFSIFWEMSFYIYIFAANLFILFLFYLQPTPRTSRYLLYLFLTLNLVLLVLKIA